MDPDYVGLEKQGVTASEDPELMEKYGDYLAPAGCFDEGGYWQENMPGQLIDGTPEPDYDEYELDPYADDEIAEVQPALLMGEIESILASLLTQGLMHGYLTHRNPRFAIPGAKLRGALPTGFPNVWETISAREKEDNSVPGWVKPPQISKFGGPALGGAGRVVNLSGARPVGVQ
jgi:hypothetical protein